MKKILKSTCILGLTLLSLTACSTNKEKAQEVGSNEAVEAQNTNQTGEALQVMLPEWAAPSDKLLQEFKSLSGVDVVVNKVDWDAIRDKIGIAASGGNAAADVVEVDWSWVGEFNSADWLEPIFVTDDQKKDMPTISSFSIGDKVLAIPYSNDYRIAYYNKNHFEAAGINEAPKTYDDIYKDMKAIKEKGIVEHPYPLVLTAEEKACTGLIWTAFTMNGKVFNDDDTLNEESVKDALKFYDKLIKDDLVDPADKTANGMETYRRIATGSASFLTGPTSYISTVEDSEKSQVVGQIQAILMPGKTDTAKVTMALPEALGITKFSKNKDMARAFIDWYTSADVQKKLNEELGNLPTRNSVLEELINEGKIKNPGAMLEEAKLIASPFPNGVPVYYSEMSNAIYNAINGMALGNLNVDEAFEQMDTKIKEIIKENK